MVEVMAKHYTHWCLRNGCGKKVVSLFMHNKIKKRYECTKCGERYTKEEVKG